MTGWETFTGRRLLSRSVYPTVRLATTGQFYLNPAAAQFLGNATRIMLLWNPERRWIGMQAAQPGNSHSYALSNVPGTDARKVSATAFLRYHGLQDLAGQTFRAHLEGGVLVVPVAPATDAVTAVES